jgi:DNA-binding beta-propeller fold protein YncE
MTIARPRTSGFLRVCLFLLAALAAAAPALHAQSVSLGTVPVGKNSSQLTAIKITTAGTLGSAVGLTQGAPALDFNAEIIPSFVFPGTCSLNIFYSAGQTCYVETIFTPRLPGLRLGAAQLLDPTGTIVLGTTLLTGTGTGPAAVFPGNPTTAALAGSYSLPAGIAVDSAGNVYVADIGSSLVDKIVAVNGITSPNSTVIPIGSGFNTPYGVAVDGAGNVYVADAGNGAVKEILAVDGVTSANSTVIIVGNGIATPYGVAVDGSGNVYVGDYYDNAVKEILAVNGVTSANSTVITLGNGFYYPYGVAVDASGNVYVADNYNFAVKEILAVNGVTSANSTVITLGNGFYFPFGVAVDASGNVYVADTYNFAIKEILAVNGVTSANSTVITLANGNIAPYGVTVDSAGNVYVADTGNHEVKEIPLATPPSLAFATTNLNTTSPDSPQTIQVQNIGNAPLAISNFTASTNFSIDHAATTCSTSIPLPSDVFCNLGVDFNPTIYGPITGTLTLTDNSSNPEQVADLSGSGPVPVLSTLTSPTPGTTLTGTTATFTWTPGVGVIAWQIDIGTSPGGHQYNPAHPQYNTTFNASGLPLDGSTIYVRLYSRINNAWQYKDYTYTAYETPPVPSVMISPISGTTLTGSTATFTWTPGTNVANWQIDIGKAPGRHDYNAAQPQYTTAFNATGLPTNGSTVYVRLYSRVNGTAWQFNDYTYTAYETPPVPSVMISPISGTTLTGSTATFTWTPGTNVANWQIDIGKAPGRHDYNAAQPQYTTTFNATGLPTNGSTVYVRLYSRVNGTAWQYHDYTYTASNLQKSPE